jgi:hypothetical protein
MKTLAYTGRPGAFPPTCSILAADKAESHPHCSRTRPATSEKNGLVNAGVRNKKL